MERANKILKISGAFLVFSIIFGYIGFPFLFKYGVKDQTSLRRRNIMRGFYLKLPIPLDFKTYFFNVSNPSAVMRGAKPILKEIGPFWYDTYKEKIEVIDNDAEDSLTYTPYETFFYNQEKSGALSDSDYVTILHPIIVGIFNYIYAHDMGSLLPVVLKALKHLAKNPNSIYLTVKVRDILFDGILINCSSKDYPVRALCPQVRSLLANFITEEKKNYIMFSFLGQRNGTIPKRFKVLRGVKKSSDLGRVIEFNDKSTLEMWSTKKCNRFHGTDGWIFPPFLKPEEGIWTFAHDLCRNVQAKYIEDVNFRGISARKYLATLGDMSTNPEEKCYCPTRQTCLPKGVMDLSKCMGVPIYASLPHLLETTPALLAQVNGLEPKMDEHAVSLIFEYMTGVPLKAAKRMQFNLPIKPRNQVEFMRQLPEALHPIIWVEESVELTGSLFYQIYAVTLLVKIMNYAKYVFIGIGAAGVGTGAYLHYKSRNAQKITPVHSALSSEKSWGDESELYPNKDSEKSSVQEVRHIMSNNEIPDDNEKGK